MHVRCAQMASLDIFPSLPQGTLRTARILRHLIRGEYVAPASVRKSEQEVGSGWWWPRMVVGH